MRPLVAVMLGALGVVLIIAGVNGSAENLFTSVLGTSPKPPKSKPLPHAQDGYGAVIGGALQPPPTKPGVTPLPGGGSLLPNGGTLI